MLRPISSVAWAALASVALMSGGTRAADAADPFSCRPDGNQQEMNACAVRDFRTADAELNIRYGEVMELLSPRMRAALRTEQRTWLRARDPGCKQASRQSEGGSIWALEFYTCLEQSTRQRTTALGLWKSR
ncbi:MAG: hypothetical protein JWQ41_2725 [Variovorax sp.]|nr:hypothetical protein [Variovorax sp.]